MDQAWKAGLEDVIAARSAVCQVDGEAGRLYYRGYEIGDLAESFNRLQETAVQVLERQVVVRRNTAEMFGNVRVAQPPHRRCDADGTLEPLNHCDAGDLCLPIAKADLFD